MVSKPVQLLHCQLLRAVRHLDLGGIHSHAGPVTALPAMNIDHPTRIIRQDLEKCSNNPLARAREDRPRESRQVHIAGSSRGRPPGLPARLLATGFKFDVDFQPTRGQFPEGPRVSRHCAPVEVRRHFRKMLIPGMSFGVGSVQAF